jgi:NAD(P)-dependent dehydrogenase (short-subunit alcohol dehydrogenase family)
MKIIVIGATGTIGAAVADGLATRHEVVRASRSGQPSVDIDDLESVTALFDRIGDVDGVVVCAPSVGSAMAARRPLAQLTDAQFNVAVQRLMSQVRLVRAAMPRVRDGGSITLTTGQLATHPMPGTTALTMAGAGLEGFIRAAALDMPRRLRINSVSPGWIKETMEQAGLDSAPGMPARQLADFYVAAVEGTMTGTVIDPTAC